MNESQNPAMIQDFLQTSRYDPQPEKVELVQTHASWVFLAGDYVYKIKKPVDFGFLDFSTLAKRSFYCQEELRLNRRLGGDYYLRVENVVKRDGGFFWGGKGTIVDHAVVMRRLPEAFLMRQLLADDLLQEKQLDELVALLGTFYEAAKVFKDGRFGSRDKVRFDVEENFSQTKSFVNNTIMARDYQRIIEFSNDFLKDQHKLFVRRVKEGAVREGHGDLHMEHVCLPPEAPLVYDCIEFNKRFRRLDVVNDIAFLAMDLEENNRFDYAAYFIENCANRLGSLFDAKLLFFYKCYRAYVRGKVLSFLSADAALGEADREQARERAARYFRLATIYACKPPAGITLLAGVSGSGKSYLARAMSSLWGIKWLRSDVVRKELHGLSGQKAAAPFGEGIYSRDQTARTYQLLAEQAAAEVADGKPVIIDASSLKFADRNLIYAAAESSKVPIRLVVCRAPWPVLVKNLQKREADGVDVSDADIKIARRQRFEAPTLDEVEMVSWLEIDTSQDLVEQLYHLVTAL
ncbi:MAG: aminoglycoside phosphotransferase [Deltaproteobacteria bacterium]|nr:MAG: aminoglycoside phosphotransferase [Deltaproteobacteria bacterium]